MTNIIEVLSKFEGIIGTLLGVIITLIMTQVIKKLGRTYFYFTEWENSYYGGDNSGFYGEVSDVTKADSYYYKFKLQIYNNLEINKVYRDIKIVFYLQNKIVESKPNDMNKQGFGAGAIRRHELSFTNVFPKQMLEIMLDSYIEDNLLELGYIKRIYFVAKDYRNKKIKKLIKKIKKID